MLDSCGVCFGGNRNVDGCGMCFGNNLLRDSCGVCRGENEALDSCGVCFGTDRHQDVCGVCYGNSSSCAGCDGVPNSGLVVDECGVCGGLSECLGQGAGASVASPSRMLPIVAGSTASFMVCIVAGVAFLLIVRRKRAAKVYVAEKMAAAAEEAPKGAIAMFISDVQASTHLWEHYSESMEIAIDIHNKLFRELLDKHRGYEVRTEGDSFVVAFHTAAEAVRTAIELQTKLLDLEWPADVLQDRKVPVVEDEATGELLFRGLRVRIGIHWCEPSRSFSERTQRYEYFGGAMNVAQVVGDCGGGGQIVVSGDAVRRIDVVTASELGASLERMGVFRHVMETGTSFDVELYSAVPKSLAGRGFTAADLRGVELVAADLDSQPNLHRTTSQTTLVSTDSLPSFDINAVVSAKLAEQAKSAAADAVWSGDWAQMTNPDESEIDPTSTKARVAALRERLGSRRARSARAAIRTRALSASSRSRAGSRKAVVSPLQRLATAASLLMPTSDVKASDGEASDGEDDSSRLSSSSSRSTEPWICCFPLGASPCIAGALGAFAHSLNDQFVSGAVLDCDCAPGALPRPQHLVTVAAA
ncbi:uncharacterized protein AMSG_03919 [Thecamonas trahens ATCC 50062]|uniref:Guanylate cyclase domain-containing protein n=1 Tax=Thecamonas trahens ATCC 50062 TaxID=461836 RepID=A0A0L0D8S0_THETB|nr:hypothetical protein AMSG_03919 [Thecamonas trahens ATCC 50062]KNC47688.1 hypothetical protein AMSG_03919 [Thecamonas trahens ATCC 50062]|eukprot:XP_013759170.1 hypothetical protein AMSG_03919 [Thecamonas trahens ATCC 50062]